MIVSRVAAALPSIRTVLRWSKKIFLSSFQSLFFLDRHWQWVWTERQWELFVREPPGGTRSTMSLIGGGNLYLYWIPPCGTLFIASLMSFDPFSPVSATRFSRSEVHRVTLFPVTMFSFTPGMLREERCFCGVCSAFVVFLFALMFLPDPGVSGVRSMGPGLSNSVHTRPLVETLLMWLWLMMITTQY